MLHFVTSYMKQNKSRKQTLESAQSGLEISFNTLILSVPTPPPLPPSPVSWKMGGQGIFKRHF